MVYAGFLADQMSYDRMRQQDYEDVKEEKDAKKRKHAVKASSSSGSQIIETIAGKYNHNGDPSLDEYELPIHKKATKLIDAYAKKKYHLAGISTTSNTGRHDDPWLFMTLVFNKD